MPFSQKSQVIETFPVVTRISSSILSQSHPLRGSKHPWIPLRYCVSSFLSFFFFPSKPLSFKQPHLPRRLPVPIFKPPCLSCFQLVTELWSDTSKGTSNLQQVILPRVLFPSNCLAFPLFTLLHLQLLPCSSPGYRSVLQKCT